MYTSIQFQSDGLQPLSSELEVSFLDPVKIFQVFHFLYSYQGPPNTEPKNSKLDEQPKQRTGRPLFFYRTGRTPHFERTSRICLIFNRADSPNTVRTLLEPDSYTALFTGHTIYTK